VLTAGLAGRLFPYQDALAMSVKVAGTYYQVVGLIQERNMPEQRTQSGQIEGEPLDNNVYIPLSTSRSRFGEVIIRRMAGSIQAEQVELHQITVQMNDLPSVETADPQIKTLMKRFRSCWLASPRSSVLTRPPSKPKLWPKRDSRYWTALSTPCST
jgi:putative ABC transport system permease protein